MDFLTLVKQRRATHHFLPGKEITDNDFRKIMETVRLTPSGYNAQPWEFILVREKDNLKKIQEVAFDQPHLAEASGVVIVLGDKVIGRHAKKIMKDWFDYGYCNEDQFHSYLASMTKERDDNQLREMTIRNSALAAMTFIYAAEDLGFATCPMMGFSKWKLEKILEIPEDRVVVLMIAIGYADTSRIKPRLPRKTVEDMCYREKFGEPFIERQKKGA